MNITVESALVLLVATGATAALAFAPPCWAAGPWLSESGGADTGMAGAGRAALALDAASLAGNPATIGGLADGTSVTVAAMPLRLDYEFHGSNATPGSATNEEGVIVLPAAYAVHRDDRFSYGLGAYSYLALSFDSGATWAGARAIERAGLETFNIAPAVAWALSDRWTIGAAVAAQRAALEARLAVGNDDIYYGPPSGLPDGHLELSGDSWAAGGQLGVTWEGEGGARVGLAWTAPVDHSVPVDLSTNGIHPVLAPMLPPDGAAKIVFTVPQQLLLGVAGASDDGTLWTFGASWQDWSALGPARLQLPTASSPLFPGGLHDTWGASIGVRRAFSDRWTASAGVGYDSSPAPDRGVPTYFPVAEQWRIAAGAERRFSESLRLRAGLSVVLQGDAKVVQESHPMPLPGVPPLTGQYTDTRVYLVSLAADFAL